MELLKKLSDYDVFAHLPQGIFTLAIFDYLLGTHVVIGAKWSLSEGLLALLVAYVVGQLISSPASQLLERGLVGKILGTPVFHLLKPLPRDWQSRWLLSDYTTPLPPTTQVVVLSKLGVANPAKADAEAIFWTTYSAAKQDEYTRSRLSTFLNQYTFCRNIAFVALLFVIGIALKSTWLAMSYEWRIDWTNVWIAIAALVTSAMMSYRFLKFYRLYSLEILTYYARN